MPGSTPKVCVAVLGVKAPRGPIQVEDTGSRPQQFWAASRRGQDEWGLRMGGDAGWAEKDKASEVRLE